jgi:hypothetical protein
MVPIIFKHVSHQFAHQKTCKDWMDLNDNLAAASVLKTAKQDITTLLTKNGHYEVYYWKIGHCCHDV